jgi:hypothetical protein
MTKATTIVLCCGLIACSRRTKEAESDALLADALLADAVPPPCAPFDVTIEATTAGNGPVWIGDAYVLVTAGAFLSPSDPDTGETVMSLVSDTGMPGGVFSSIPQSLGYVNSITSDGSNLAACTYTSSSTEPNTLRLIRIGHDGSMLGTTAVASTNVYANDCQVAWAGDRYVVAWQQMESPLELFFQEISSDGTLGALATLTPSVNLSLADLFTLGVTSTTYGLLVHQQYQTTLVLLDRNTQKAIYYASPIDGWLAARDPLFGLVADGIGSPVQFLAVDGNGNAMAPVTLAFSGTENAIVATSAGYRIYGESGPIIGSGSNAVLDIDLDANGSALDQTATVANGSGSNFQGVWAVSRVNGYAAEFGYGGNGAYTQRLVQQCAP